MSVDDVPALACVPAAISVTERQQHFALGGRLFGVESIERLSLPNGYALRFDPGAFDAVARFVANERKCCPFLTLELTVEPQSGPVWLRMTGPEGLRPALGPPDSCLWIFRNFAFRFGHDTE